MSPERPVNPPFFQVGVLVEDLDAARDELSQALGVTWGEAVERTLGESPLRICFSLEGPPYLELIEGPPGSPWGVTDGPRIDHIGYWTPDIEASKPALDAKGLELEVDGARLGVPFSYHRGRASGLRVELIDSATQSAFYERWGLQDPRAS